MFIIKALGAFALIISTILVLGIALIMIPILLPEARPYFRSGWKAVKGEARKMMQASA